MERVRWKQQQKSGVHVKTPMIIREGGGKVYQQMKSSPRRQVHVEEEEMAASCGLGDCCDAGLSHPFQQ